MAIAEWPSFHAFVTLEQEMHQLLDRLGARPWSEGFGWKPDTDILRRDGEILVEVELPGIDPLRDLEIEIEEKVLQIRGQKQRPDDVGDADRYVSECRFGAFRRSVMLPSGTDAETVTADYENGVLIVRIPLPEVPPEVKSHEVPLCVPIGSGG
jgi:HSP20 family protein